MGNQHVHALPVRQVGKNHFVHELVATFHEVIEITRKAQVHQKSRERLFVSPHGHILERATALGHHGIQGIRRYRQEIPTINFFHRHHFSGFATALCNLCSGRLGAQEIGSAVIERFIALELCAHIKCLLKADFGQRRFFAQTRFTFGMTQHKDNLCVGRGRLVDFTHIVKTIGIGRNSQSDSGGVTIETGGRHGGVRRGRRICRSGICRRVRNRISRSRRRIRRSFRIRYRTGRIGSRVSSRVCCRIRRRISCRISRSRRICRGYLFRNSGRCRRRVRRIISTASNNYRNKCGTNHRKSFAGNKFFHIHRFSSSLLSIPLI